MTVLFADMAGYTALSQPLSEEQTYLMIQRVQCKQDKAAHAHGGTMQEMLASGTTNGLPELVLTMHMTIMTGILLPKLVLLFLGAFMDQFSILLLTPCRFLCP